MFSQERFVRSLPPGFSLNGSFQPLPVDVGKHLQVGTLSSGDDHGSIARVRIVCYHLDFKPTSRYEGQSRLAKEER